MSKRTTATPRSRLAPLPKVATGIPGFDFVAEGGLPLGRTTLVGGTAGSGKTVFVSHFIAAGIAIGEPGVFVTFEDAPADIRQNLASFGWDVAAWEKDGMWTFVDVAPDPQDTPVPAVGEYDLGALLSRILHAVRRTGAKRVALDSVNALFLQLADRAMIRAELFRITSAVKRAGATVLFTSERPDDYGPTSQFGIEEFVADNVVILRNILENETRRRTLEILKFRGATHQRGEVPFIVGDDGISVIALAAQQLTQSSSTVRVTSGIKALDRMCHGGFFRDSIVLASGATGTGKTLLVTQFLNGGVAKKEKALLFAFEESRDQLFRNARAWGMDFDKAEKQGRLRVINRYPHAMPMEDHLVQMRDLIEEFGPHRVAVDSLSALERVFTIKSFREFVISLTSMLKRRQTTGLFTSTTPSLLGGGSVTEKHISTLTDSIVLLRYVEAAGRMRRSIAVLKMRGSPHDPALREYTIDDSGMRIGEPFRDVSGILAGMVTPVAVEDSTD